MPGGEPTRTTAPTGMYRHGMSPLHGLPITGPIRSLRAGARTSRSGRVARRSPWSAPCLASAGAGRRSAWLVGSYCGAHVRDHRRATTATSRTARTRRAGAFQFVLALLGDDGDAEGPAVVGRRTTAITTSTPTSPRTFTRRRSAASGGRTSAGSSRSATRRPTSSASRTSRSTPSCACSTATTSLLAVALAASSCISIGGCDRAGLGLLRLARALLARHVLHQLARARVRPPPLRDDRRLAQQRRCSRCSRSARAGTTTTTTTRARARQGFYWWEIDVSYYVLKALELRRHRVGRAGRAAPRPRSAGRAGARARRGYCSVAVLCVHVVG